MPYFQEPSVSSYKYHGYNETNDPVNLNMCQRISKSTHNYYPDNTGIPSIVFHGCDASWNYPKVEDRDKDFYIISKLRTSPDVPQQKGLDDGK